MNRPPDEPEEPPSGTEKRKMRAGELYRADDPELVADAERAAEWMDRYNASTTQVRLDRLALLRAQFGAVGEGSVVRAPVYIDYGTNIFLAERVFINFGCVVLDVAPVSIGARTMVGPNVQFLTADHPRDVALRAKALEFGRPITVGEDVWIGAGAMVLPGISIGHGAIVGAGSIVTRDVPAGATVAGNPARPVQTRR